MLITAVIDDRMEGNGIVRAIMGASEIVDIYILLA
jgi:hypothetical protein